MHLSYFDESGNTGNNLTDDNQPVFVLCALAVPADRWQLIGSTMPDVLAWLQGQYKKERPGA